MDGFTKTARPPARINWCGRRKGIVALVVFIYCPNESEESRDFPFPLFLTAFASYLCAEKSFFSPPSSFLFFLLVLPLASGRAGPTHPPPPPPARQLAGFPHHERGVALHRHLGKAHLGVQPPGGALALLDVQKQL